MNLEKILSYKNKYVFKRYQKDYPNNKLTAHMAFHELMKYFWLSKKHKIDITKNQNNKELDFMFAMYSEMKEIDDMWHTFLLFTKEYTSFCEENFGEFIHHQPNIDEEEISAEVFKRDFNRFVSYVYDNLGEKTLKIWFSELFDH